jgi:2-C-methyl-D-erythritol 2,4-cyclodiphosphate synthase
MSDDRVGIGYDVHRLAKGNALVLGGVEIPFHLGTVAHSDGDVLIHALMDALLGASGLGDIGQQFPDDDARFAGVSSRHLLCQVVEMVEAAGYQVVNLDTTIICEAPKMAPHVAGMRTNIASDLGCAEDAVGIKATTHEGLGTLGRSEGIAAQAIVLITKR